MNKKVVFIILFYFLFGPQSAFGAGISSSASHEKMRNAVVPDPALVLSAKNQNSEIVTKIEILETKDGSVPSSDTENNNYYNIFP